MGKKDGMSYAPKGKPSPVVGKGEFVFSVTGLDHGHIAGITNGLLEAGATIKYVYDPDQEKVDRFITAYPDAIPCDSLDTILNDGETKLVAGACITSERADLGIRIMQAGKDYITDKAPFTTLEQIERAEKTIAETKQKYLVYYSEMVHVEGAVYAKQLVDDGIIGKVVQVMNLGPHRLNAQVRPDWFFVKEKYGGILCDIGCHNIYQFFEYADIDKATVIHSAIGNYNHPEYPELDDFGEASLVSDKGHSHYFRVDWFTPDGLDAWGDGRLIILGTEGYIEVRKYIDAGRSKDGDNVLVVTNEEEHFECVTGKVGFPFFGQMILDCMHRTETAQSQRKAIEASRLSIMAQNMARKLV